MPGKLKRISLTWWIMISIVVGVAIGVLFPEQSQYFQVVSNIFLNLIKCIIVPLLFNYFLLWWWASRRTARI